MPEVYVEDWYEERDAVRDWLVVTLQEHLEHRGKPVPSPVQLGMDEDDDFTQMLKALLMRRSIELQNGE